jgi:hypothetical protein
MPDVHIAIPEGVESALGIKAQATPLGSGNNGTAYRIDSNSVLKLTVSLPEAYAQNLLFDVMQSPAGDAIIGGINPPLSKSRLVGKVGPSHPFGGMNLYAYITTSIAPLTRDEIAAVPKSVPDLTREDSSGNYVKVTPMVAAYNAANSLWLLRPGAPGTKQHTKRKLETLIAKARNQYLEALDACASVPGFEDSAEAVIRLSTDNAFAKFGGPWVVGDYKPANCGRDSNGKIVAYDLFLYSNEQAFPKYLPKALGE